MSRPAFRLATLFSLVSVVACTTETIVKEAAPPAPTGTEQGPQGPAEHPPIPQEEGPWREVKPLVSEVRSLSCPSDTEVHAATSTGLYRLEGDAWKVIAPGDFSSVSMASETSGFAGGDGTLLQRAGSTWAPLDGTANWKITAVYTSSEGAWIGGSGYTYVGKNQLPVEPKLWFVANDLTLRDERAYGSRLTAGSVTSIAGYGTYAVMAAGSLLQTWSGAGWESAPSDYFLTGGYRSTAMITSNFFATNGRQIAMPQGVHYDPVGGGPEIAQLVTYKSSLVAVGAAGSVLIRSSKGDYKNADTTEPVDLTTACATSAGALWVAGGKRVFRRHDAIQ